MIIRKLFHCTINLKKKDIELHSFQPGHPSLAITYINMAVIFESPEQYHDAIYYAERAMNIFHDVFGLNHLKTE